MTENKVHIQGVPDDMIANNVNAAFATHPGEIIKDEIEYRGITQKKLADETGISPTVVSEVLNGKRALTTQYALLIGAALDLDPQPLIRLQVDYDLHQARTDSSFIKRLKSIRKIAAVL